MIKTGLFLFCLSFFIVSAASAQVSSHFGVKAGANFSRLAQEGSTSLETRMRTTFHVGGMYRLRFNRFVFQPELLYSTKGGILRNKDQEILIRNQYHYVSAPILLGYVPTEGLTLQAGPEFSYALKTGGNTDPGQRQDFGIVVGAHYDFLDMLDKFSLHLRYVHGVRNVSNVAIVERYNRVFQASIVYNFYKKK